MASLKCHRSQPSYLLGLAVAHYDLHIRLVVKFLDFEPMAEHKTRHVLSQIQTSMSWRLGTNINTTCGCRHDTARK